MKNIRKELVEHLNNVLVSVTNTKYNSEEYLNKMNTELKMLETFNSVDEERCKQSFNFLWNVFLPAKILHLVGVQDAVISYTLKLNSYTLWKYAVNLYDPFKLFKKMYWMYYYKHEELQK